jgi:hypothetical protein
MRTLLQILAHLVPPCDVIVRREGLGVWLSATALS